MKTDTNRNESSLERRLFDWLHEAYRRRIEGFFRRRTGEPELAAELSQEVFTRAYAARSSIDDSQDLGAWLSGIARNLWIDHFRKTRRTPEFVSLDPPLEERLSGSLDPEKILKRKVLQQQLRKALSRLGPLQRKAASLKWLAGWSDREIARVLELSLPATRSLLHRIRTQLRMDLQAFAAAV
jgi:RNA polymerase sigma-70 factor (ECF subfamily)